MSFRKPPGEGFTNSDPKLQKPSRKSAFEKQKAEAEAKRAREAAETAAVFEDFVKSFDNDAGGGDSHGDGSSSREVAGAVFLVGPGLAGQAPVVGGGAASRRHFVQSGSALKSGPGSLGPAPPAFGKKRAFDAYQKDGAGRPWDKGDRGDDEEEAEGSSRKEEDMVAKPTLQLAQLPPGISPAAVKALVPSSLTVEGVKILPSAMKAATERKSTVAIVTLSQETPAADIDAVVTQLQNRYLGFGYYLSIHRHLSSAVTASTATSLMNTSSSASQPFGAKPISLGNNNSHAHQGGFHHHHRGFAPPTSYGPSGAVNRSGLMHVPVNPPQDVKTIQMINMVIEGLLEHGPEFEALLMSRPDVQREEKWAWLWNARGEAGVWYRWKLWQVVTGTDPTPGRQKYYPLFEDSHAWKEPKKGLPFEYAAELDELVSDPDYNSTDDEEWENDGDREPPGKEVEKTFLNPLEKARLAHLLARLPTTLSRIRKGDIARVTAFAITHASRGADEVVDMIVANIDKPFSQTGANPQKKSGGGKDRDSSPEGEDGKGGANESNDDSAARLVGLYVISDVLSSSSTSVVRHAWRFRQLFETALKDHKTFEKLGMMPHKNQWGRLRADKWKRSVNLVLNLWEGWCVFTAESQERFVRHFEEPPELQNLRKAEVAQPAQGGKWKPVDAPSVAADAAPLPPMADDDDDVEGEPMVEDDVEGEPMSEGEDDVEGAPMDEDDVDSEARATTGLGQHPPRPKSPDPRRGEGVVDASTVAPSSRPMGRPRNRIRAVDMFADSGESD
ncbi:unnamed protein product [Parascedosporium putredinis]|uniref:CID domain-containing protein n=1 Tax=Parascedosporium putredinis TaxID=1442378 RepID=A0A9P1MEF9_9PEZI|nr:unnamed protein product [Parascedosporium putredinis]CAI8004577.1 unnamed protein product [Parascedosporium putredinis]